MKLAIVGGGAASTPALFLTSEMRSLRRPLDVMLIGRSNEKLSAVRRAARLINDNDCINVDYTTDLAGLDDADVVLLQMRYGGYEARARDETFPLRFDACGDEGLGAGGLAAAWRSWPHLRIMLDAVGARCPRAAVLLMTAPLSLLTRCAKAAFPMLDIVGICELPWTTLKTVCAYLRVPVSQVRFSYAGVNHLGWFDELQYRGTDLIDSYADLRRAVDTFPSGELIAHYHAIPLKYMTLHYDAAATLERQRSLPSRALELAEFAQSALRIFARGENREIRDALEHRPTPWYSDAVAPIVDGLMGNPTSQIFFLSTTNGAYLDVLPPDDIVERPFSVADGKPAKLIRGRELSVGLRDTLCEFVEYERSAARAVLESAMPQCSAVLAKHPWFRGRDDLDALADGVIAAI